MINLALDTVETISGLSWLALWVSVSGAIVRLTIGKTRHPFDPLWSLLFFLSCYQLGYVGRWVMGYSPDPSAAPDINSLIALRLGSTMLALAFLHRRMTIEGWRW